MIGGFAILLRTMIRSPDTGELPNGKNPPEIMVQQSLI